MNKILFAALFVCNATFAGPNECAQGARAAYEAYLMSTYDAKNPDAQKMANALDFRLSQQPFPADAKSAYKALSYIAVRLKEAGVRAVNDYEVSAAAGQFVVRECSK